MTGGPGLIYWILPLTYGEDSSALMSDPLRPLFCASEGLLPMTKHFGFWSCFVFTMTKLNTPWYVLANINTNKKGWSHPFPTLN